MLIEEQITNGATIRFDKESPTPSLWDTAEGVEGFETSEELRLIFDFGLTGEYFNIRCFNIQIVYEQKSDL